MRPIRRSATSSMEEITRLLPDVGASGPSLQTTANCDPVSPEPSATSPFLSFREAAEWAVRISVHAKTADLEG